ncbi:hypothetical protein CKM354_001277900 [Cercospora kikuchii]|uniref:Uncharacterized protein n=1 Tax=Cercospora kikuchii TaxID=84275 RepID=A0A9P3L326_9PEZI|nr:uncharacterized protein CKM354_001277900 [Cercospora kikuchii]GIZ49752.1 hypothetical protein CKM354_001277900 [Cercospora kikuchii]
MNPFAQLNRPILSAETQRSPEVLHETLAQTLQSPSASLSDVKAQLHALRPWLVGLDPQSRYAEVSKYFAGARTLSWLWGKAYHISNDLLRAYGFLQDLAVFLVAERKDRFMEDWLFVELSKEDEAALDTNARLWRATLWRSLILAELVFATSSTLCLDAPILRLFNLHDKRRSFPSDPSPGRTSAWPAVLIIVGHVGPNDCSSTNVRLYEDLIRYAEGFEKKKQQNHFPALSVGCKLRLCHPTRPNAEPFLRQLKLQQELDRDDLPANRATFKARASLMELIKRAEVVLSLDDPQGALGWLQQTKHAYQTAFAQRGVMNIVREKIVNALGDSRKPSQH